MSEKDTGVHCPSKTCWDRPTRTHQARYWEFRQYDLKLFDPANLEHKHLEYYCYQFQELDGHKHAHGILRFGVKQNMRVSTNSSVQENTVTFELHTVPK